MDERTTIDMRELAEAPPASGAAERRRTALFGDLVRAATARGPGRAWTTPLRCPGRRRTGRCPGRLRVLRTDVPSEIQWECTRCARDGRIVHWQGTVWDLSGPPTTALPDEPEIEVVLPRADYDVVVERCRFLARGSERIVAGAEWRSDGLVLRGTPDDLDFLAGEIAFEINHGEEGPALRRLEAVIDRVDEALEEAWAEESEPPSNGGPADGPPAAFPGALLDAMRETVAANPDVSRIELQEALDDLVRAHNTRPQAELCGLSPEEVQRLIMADWGTPGGVVETNAELSLEDLSGTRYLANARVFLAALEEEGGTRATQAGNLNRAFVERMLEEGRFRNEIFPIVMEYRKVVNEGDVLPLHELRVVLVQAGLAKKRTGTFSLTARGAELLAEEAAGALYERLFLTYFRRFNLAYLDGYPEAPEFQHALAVTLHRFGEIGDWLSPKRVVSEAVLPVVRRSVPLDADRYDSLPGLVRRRLLDPLVDFGLAEARTAERPEEVAEFPEWAANFPSELRMYRKSALFDRFLTFRPRGR